MKPMSDPKLIQKLLDLSEEIGTLVDRAHKELDPDQFRAIERNAERILVTLQRLSTQLGFLEDQFFRFKGRPLRRRPQNAIIYDFKPTKRRPSKGPGSKR